MSTCISRHGEFSDHEPDQDHVCTLCHVLDEDALIAEVKRLRDRVAELKDQIEMDGIHQRAAERAKRLRELTDHPIPCPNCHAMGYLPSDELERGAYDKRCPKCGMAEGFVSSTDCPHK